MRRLTIEELMKLRLSSCSWELPDCLPSAEDVLDWFALLEAGWVHDGDPKRPHAMLHSGNCSTGFFLCKKVLKYGNLREILAACMIRKLRRAGMQRCDVDGVFGSPYSSILLAGAVARLLDVPVYVPEKDPSDPLGKRMIFKSDDPIPQGSSLLQVEELITTFDSGDATRLAIFKGNPFLVRFAPFVSVLIHRPAVISRVLPDCRVIVPFIEKQVDAWKPTDCPLCKQGSVPLRPKGENWAKLTA